MIYIEANSGAVKRVGRWAWQGAGAEGQTGTVKQAYGRVPEPQSARLSSGVGTRVQGTNFTLAQRVCTPLTAACSLHMLPHTSSVVQPPIPHTPGATPTPRSLTWRRRSTCHCPRCVGMRKSGHGVLQGPDGAAGKVVHSPLVQGGRGALPPAVYHMWWRHVYVNRLGPGLTALPYGSLQHSTPQGDVHKRKEIVQDVTLHDLDSANARPQVRWWLGARAATGSGLGNEEHARPSSGARAAHRENNHGGRRCTALRAPRRQQAAALLSYSIARPTSRSKPECNARCRASRAGRRRHHERHGLHAQTQEDGDHGQAAAGDQQGRQGKGSGAVGQALRRSWAGRGERKGLRSEASLTHSLYATEAFPRHPLTSRLWGQCDGMLYPPTTAVMYQKLS